MSSEVSTFTIAKWVGHRGTRMIEEVYGHLRSGYQLPNDPSSPEDPHGSF